MGRRPKEIEGEPLRRAFLEEFAKRGNLTYAARAAGVTRQRHYQWLQEDVDNYRARFDEAREQAADGLEGEAWRRAVDGWDEPVYQGGQEVGAIRRYDSTLLRVLLRAHRPEKYRDEVTKHEHTGGVEVVVTYVGETED